MPEQELISLNSQPSNGDFGYGSYSDHLPRRKPIRRKVDRRSKIDNLTIIFDKLGKDYLSFEECILGIKQLGIELLADEIKQIYQQVGNKVDRSRFIQLAKRMGNRQKNYLDAVSRGYQLIVQSTGADTQGVTLQNLLQLKAKYKLSVKDETFKRILDLSDSLRKGCVSQQGFTQLCLQANIFSKD